MRYRSFAVIATAVFAVSCLNTDPDSYGGKTHAPVSDDSLSLRQLTGKYYANAGFMLGAAVETSHLMSSDTLAGIFYAQFPLMYSSSDFSQANTTPGFDPTLWNPASYRFVTTEARNHAQKIRAVSSVGPYCSAWAKDDNRTGGELEGLLNYYVSGICKAMAANSDVVVMCDLIEDCISPGGISGTGYDGSGLDDGSEQLYDLGDWLGPREGDSTFENPWTKLGMQTVTLDGVDFEFPSYIALAFKVANQNAPNLKKYITQSDNDLTYAVWEKMKNLVMALRSLGLRVDGICWKAHIPLGWEQNATHLQDLRKLIDWCYLNNVEFHISELAVSIPSPTTSFYDEAAVESTLDRQAATCKAVADLVLAQAGHGAASMSLGYINGNFDGSTTWAGLWSLRSFDRYPSYYALQSSLISCGTNK